MKVKMSTKSDLKMEQREGEGETMLFVNLAKPAAFANKPQGEGEGAKTQDGHEHDLTDNR